MLQAGDAAGAAVEVRGAAVWPVGGGQLVVGHQLEAGPVEAKRVAG